MTQKFYNTSGHPDLTAIKFMRNSFCTKRVKEFTMYKSFSRQMALIVKLFVFVVYKGLYHSSRDAARKFKGRPPNKSA